MGLGSDQSPLVVGTRVSKNEPKTTKNNHMPTASQITQFQRGDGGRPVGKCNGIRKMGKMSGIQDQPSSQRSSHRPRESVSGGAENKRSMRMETGLAETRATIIISQPTRFPRWRATISAPNTAKTMGMAIPQPSASTRSNRFGRTLRWVAQDTNWAAAPITARPQSAQANRRMEREEVIASDLAKWLCGDYDNT